MNIFERNAKIIVLFACLAASSSFVFIRLAGDMPSLAIGFYRLGFAMPFLIPVLGYHKKELMSLSKKQVIGCIFTGLL